MIRDPQINQKRQINPKITKYDQSRSRHNHPIILVCHKRGLKCLINIWDLKLVKNPKLAYYGTWAD